MTQPSRGAVPGGSAAHDAFVSSSVRLAAYKPWPPSRPPAIGFTPSVGPPLPALVRDPRAGPPTSDDVIHAASAALARGDVSARELVDQCAVAIDKHDADLVGFAEVQLDTARAAADACDRAQSARDASAPLFGIPLSVKDVIDVAGMTTRCGSLAYDDRPGSDALSVARLRAAGAIVIGKATTHEFALGVTSPQSRNPHDPSRIPGGSSGGSAVTVATGMALGSLGTDTRASIRVPAALCGLVGLKPTFGTIATDGVVPLSWTMDHVAPMARTVRDAALLLDVLTAAGGSFVPWATASVDGWRVGVPRAAFAGCDDAVAPVLAAAVDVVESIAGTVVDVDRPTSIDFDDANAAGLYVSRCEAAAFHRALKLDRTQYWPEVADQLDEADRVLATDYLDAQRLRADLGTRLLALFDSVDLLVMPTVPVVAPPIDDFARFLLVLSRNAIPWSFLGYPALSVPCGTDAAGLPVGLQIVGPPGHDGPVVALGAAFERARR